MEGDFINNIICKYNFFGESLTKLYYLVKSRGESLVQNGESQRNTRVVAVSWHQEGIQEEIVKEIDNIVGELDELDYLPSSTPL